MPDFSFGRLFLRTGAEYRGAFPILGASSPSTLARTNGAATAVPATMMSSSFISSGGYSICSSLETPSSEMSGPGNSLLKKKKNFRVRSVEARTFANILSILLYSLGSLNSSWASRYISRQKFSYESSGCCLVLNLNLLKTSISESGTVSQAAFFSLGGLPSATSITCRYRRIAMPVAQRSSTPFSSSCSSCSSVIVRAPYRTISGILSLLILSSNCLCSLGDRDILPKLFARRLIS